MRQPPVPVGWWVFHELVLVLQGFRATGCRRVFPYIKEPS
jgi:hypothetical protein